VDLIPAMKSSNRLWLFERSVPAESRPSGLLPEIVGKTERFDGFIGTSDGFAIVVSTGEPGLFPVFCSSTFLCC